MTRALFTVYSVITVCFTGMILLAVLAGSMRSQPAALAGFDDCQLPCWNKITPEETPPDRANSFLSNAGYVVERVNHHWRYITYRPTDQAACKAALSYEAYVFLTELIECTGIALGDVIAVLGPPQEIALSIPFDSFMFRNGTVAVIARRQRCQTDFSLYSEVTSIRLRAQAEASSATEQVFAPNSLPWRGLLPLWGYDGEQLSRFTNC
jgi:hypothetical protein